MRFLWNDQTAFNLSLTLIFSAIRLGSQGSNDKEKMRSTLKAIMVNFLNFSDEEFTFMKRDGNIMADEAWEDNQFDDFTSKEYYDQKVNYGFKYSIPRY